MPYFLTQRDPTGPGYEWVRTGKGWKILTSDVGEQVNRQIKKFARGRIPALWKNERPEGIPGDEGGPSCSRSSHDNAGLDKTGIESDYILLPSSWRSSNRTGALTIGHIFNRFDLCSAVRDNQRFNYVCKLLEIICDRHFASLSGSAVRELFSILEEVVGIVKDTQQHIRRITKLLETVKSRMDLYSSHLVGSRVMYNCRSHLLNVWLEQLQNIQLYEREEDGEMTLMDLPLDCLEHLFRAFSNPRDVIHLGQTCHQLNAIGSSPILWAEMFEYNFSEEHLSAVPDVDGIPDWKAGFKNMRKKAKLREEYAVAMELCCHCSCIYWQGGRHPCSNDTLKEKQRPHEVGQVKEIDRLPLDPEAFLKLTMKV